MTEIERIDLVHKAINEYVGAMEVDVTISADGKSFWICPISEEMTCPFSCIFSVIEDSVYCYWQVNHSIAPSDKSDIYFLWMTSMGIVLKFIFCESVYFSVVEHPIMENEVYGAVIVFSNSKESIDKNIGNFIDRCLSMFFVALGINGKLFGSYGNEIVQREYDFSRYESFYDCKSTMFREDHSFFSFGDNLYMLELSERQYNPAVVLNNFSNSWIEGVDEYILIQTNGDKKAYNAVPKEIYTKIQSILSLQSSDQFCILCQEDMLFVLEGQRIWILVDDFGSYKLPKQRDMINHKRKEEDEFRFANLEMSWKYPIDFSRFEELIADLLEEEPGVNSVRLMGKANNADGGRDILIFKRKFDGKSSYIDYVQIAQCKAYKNSVNKNHVLDIRDTIERYEAKGYFLAVASTITTPLIDHLLVLKNKYDVAWWTEREIFTRLRRNPDILKMFSDIVETRFSRNTFE